MLTPSATMRAGYASPRTPLLPAPVAPAPSAPTQVAPLLQDVAFAVRMLRADMANFFLFQHRAVDGFLVTAKNSGTHWVKFMLSCAIAERFGVDMPGYASGPAGDTIIGHPRWAPVHGHLPRIGSSHTIPSAAFASGLPGLDHPPVVVLVRDIREALLSNFVKWQARYRVPFADYVQGDPSGKRFVADVWWYMHFFNRWGDLMRARPGRVLAVRYEDIQADPATWLTRIARHLQLDLGAKAIGTGLRYAGRADMLARLDPAHVETIIPTEAARDGAYYSRAEREQLDAILRRHLRHDFGYGYPLRTAENRSLALTPIAEACASGAD